VKYCKIGIGVVAGVIRASHPMSGTSHFFRSYMRVSRSWLWTAMNYMSTAEHYSRWRQLCVHAQICVQGSAATAGLLCMLGAVTIFTCIAQSMHTTYTPDAVTRLEA
jgi:hypothetical protein